MAELKDIPRISPSELREMLEMLDRLSNPPALMVYGPPGVGKTTILKQFAKDKGYELRVKHLSRMDPSDWSGIPKHDSNYTEFIPLSLFKPPNNKNKKIVIFFDELNTANPQVLNAALDVLLEKRSDHANAKLPDETIIVAAGNLGDEDGTYVEHLSAAVRTRLIQVRLHPDVDDWLEWAENNSIHKTVIEFINRERMGLLPLLDMKGFQNDDDQVATPRGWERVSQLLLAWEQNKNVISEAQVEKMIYGTIGVKIGRKFWRYYHDRKKEIQEIVSRIEELMQEVLKGRLAVTSELLQKLNWLFIEDIHQAQKELIKALGVFYIQGRKSGDHRVLHHVSAAGNVSNLVDVIYNKIMKDQQYISQIKNFVERNFNIKVNGDDLEKFIRSLTNFLIQGQ